MPNTSDSPAVPSLRTSDANQAGYQAELDGLRAVAVYSVVLFHAGGVGSRAGLRVWMCSSPVLCG